MAEQNIPQEPHAPRWMDPRDASAEIVSFALWGAEAVTQKTWEASVAIQALTNLFTAVVTPRNPQDSRERAATLVRGALNEEPIEGARNILNQTCSIILSQSRLSPEGCAHITDLSYYLTVNSAPPEQQAEVAQQFIEARHHDLAHGLLRARTQSKSLSEHMFTEARLHRAFQAMSLSATVNVPDELQAQYQVLLDNPTLGL